MSGRPGDLRSANWIVAKGFLFLLAGVLAAALLVAEHPTAKVVVLLGVTVWCFARFYYFAFYVIERYVDPSYRFDGLLSLMRYCLRRVRVKSDDSSRAPEQHDARGS